MLKVIGKILGMGFFIILGISLSYAVFIAGYSATLGSATEEFAGVKSMIWIVTALGIVTILYSSLVLSLLVLKGRFGDRL